jgi:hypothetical protein
MNKKMMEKLGVEENAADGRVDWSELCVESGTVEHTVVSGCVTGDLTYAISATNGSGEDWYVVDMSGSNQHHSLGCRVEDEKPDCEKIREAALKQPLSFGDRELALDPISHLYCEVEKEEESVAYLAVSPHVYAEMRVWGKGILDMHVEKERLNNRILQAFGVLRFLFSRNWTETWLQ